MSTSKKPPVPPPPIFPRPAVAQPRIVPAPPVHSPHARPVAQPRAAAPPSGPGVPPPPVRWPGRGAPVQARLAPPAHRPVPPLPIVQARPVAPPRPGQLPAPPRTVQRQAPALIWPGSSRAGLIQCTLLTSHVSKVVAYISKNFATLGNLTYDDPVAVPTRQNLEDNYRIIEKGLRAEGRVVNDEHVGQVAKSLGVKVKKTLSWVNPDAKQEEEVEVIPHLEDFPRDEPQKLASHDPQNVSLLIRIDGKKVDPAPVDTQIQQSISRPDSTKEVTTTTGDGEVSPLIQALSAFVAYLQSPDNQEAPHHFTVALVGPYGPCNGCKKRLARFVDIWSEKAADLMQTGVLARLTITYKYAKIPQTQRDQYYGYPEDGIQAGPYLHTLLAQVTGTNAG